MSLRRRYRGLSIVLLIGASIILFWFICSLVFSQYYLDRPQPAASHTSPRTSRSDTPIVTSPSNRLTVRVAPNRLPEGLASIPATISDVTEQPNYSSFKWYLATSSEFVHAPSAAALVIQRGDRTGRAILTLPGTTWESLVPFQDEPRYDSNDGATYVEEGWQPSLNIGGNFLIPYVDDDDPFSGGFIRERDGYIQVSLDEERPLNLGTPDPPVRYDIFVSNWLPLATVLSEYLNTTRNAL